MDKINKTPVSQLDANLNNNLENNDNDMQLIKETIAKNKELIEKNRERLRKHKIINPFNLLMF